jgi:Methylase involved in ubiquinone/menaquinone biosynthesis
MLDLNKTKAREGHKMSDKRVNYGNWVPKKMLWILLGVALILVAGSFLPVPFFVQVILWVISGLTFLLFLYMFYLYSQFAKNGGNLQSGLWNCVLDKLSWDGRGKALDIGTGNGPLAIKVAKKCPQAKVTGIDYWGKGWSYAKEMCKRNAEIEGVGDRVAFQKASASSLPFNDGEFDAVVSNFVFHEVKDTRDKRELIREALRVVRKGGVFSFQDLFLSERFYGYGEVDNLLETIRKWGIEEVHFINTKDLVEIPRLLRVPWMLGKIGIIYGKK